MNESVLREHLRKLLTWSDAHVNYDSAVANIAAELRGTKPKDLPHSPWRLIEHMRLAQWDIVEFCRNAGHVSPPFPEGYWPTSDGPPDEAAWHRSIARFRGDLAAMVEMVADPKVDLLAPIPHGDGQTVLRGALLLADHNAYHVGQLVLMRRLLDDWPSD